MSDDPDDTILAIVEGALAQADAPQPRNREDGPGRDAREDQPDRGRDHVDRLEFAMALLPNDTDNGRRLIHWRGDELIFVRDVGWHVWNGRFWDPIGAAEAAQRLAQRAARWIAAESLVMHPTPEQQEAIDAGREARRVAEDERSDGQKLAIEEGKRAIAAWSRRRGKRRDFSVSCGNGARIAQMLTQASPHLTVAVDAMDADPYLVNLENGTLVFEQTPDPECPDPDVVRLIWSVRLKLHDRTDRLAKLMPAIFEPGAACPRWQAFLDLCQPNKAIQRFLQVFYGYSLLGIIGAQKLAFHYGEGANGKSTFIEAIWRACGSYAGTLNSESVTGTQSRGAGQATPDIAQLPGKRLVRVSELPRGEMLREALVKQLTGGEPMMARHNYGNFFELRPVFKATMSGNDKPRIDGVDLGIWRRLSLVIWAETIPEDQRREMEVILAEFAAERSGILNWLIEGTLSYLNHGLIEPPEVKEATKAYRADMDQVQGFIDACVVRQPPVTPPDEPKQLPSRMLYEAYESWCLANAMKPWSEKAFSQTMVKKGFVKHDGRIRTFEGITLRDVPERPEPRNPRYGDDR
ncbi:phage/plasmid primase, P4 family [Bosea sp. BK604]|uniref:DNA primase family protein n=1 Tax=Bosea sp. BK604 TaxID=2512180 RepID=UPI001045A523|nr:phage/plasmid primase, P4 family [Bosea sp. BK604]TCR69705.1 putative DNA primase/helicase [Bosea sp. BK604]